MCYYLAETWTTCCCSHRPVQYCGMSSTHAFTKRQHLCYEAQEKGGYKNLEKRTIDYDYCCSEKCCLDAKLEMDQVLRHAETGVASAQSKLETPDAIIERMEMREHAKKEVARVEKEHEKCAEERKDLYVSQLDS
jgi:hypothetical protein